MPRSVMAMNKQQDGGGYTLGSITLQFPNTTVDIKEDRKKIIKDTSVAFILCGHIQILKCIILHSVNAV